MATVKALDMSEELRKSVARSMQSGHINFILGSGASAPAIPIAGNAEQEIALHRHAKRFTEANRRLYELLLSVQEPTNKLLRDVPDAANTAVLTSYKNFLVAIEAILTARRTNLLPRQATIFSTNYDLFVEKASSAVPAMKLNDGFARVASLGSGMEFSSRNFFDSSYNTGNLFNYKVEVPSVNLIKLHGSFSWAKNGEKIAYKIHERKALPAGRDGRAAIRKFIDDYCVVQPVFEKFQTTVVDQTYYELLRTYANVLDRENALAIALGFSFADSHIQEITKRALKNPTLRLIIIAFDTPAVESFQEIFSAYNNVLILSPTAAAPNGFDILNQLLRTIPPTFESEK